MIGILEYTLGAMVLTLFLGYIVETVKMFATLLKVDKINKEILQILDEAIAEKEQIDIFFLEQLRTIIKEKFVNEQIIDDFKLYKVNECNIHLAYKRGMAVQQIDLFMQKQKHLWKTQDTEYFENPFEEIQL